MEIKRPIVSRCGKWAVHELIMYIRFFDEILTQTLYWISCYEWDVILSSDKGHVPKGCKRTVPHVVYDLFVYWRPTEWEQIFTIQWNLKPPQAMYGNCWNFNESESSSQYLFIDICRITFHQAQLIVFSIESIATFHVTQM